MSLFWISRFVCVGVLLFCSWGCRREVSEEPAVLTPQDAVAKVGDAWILQSDVEYYISAGLARDDASALRRLIEETQFAEAARASGIEDSAEGRAAVRRLLATRHLEAQSVEVTVSEADVRQVWEASGDRFMQPARLQIAGLRQQFVGGAGRMEAQENLNEARRHYLELPSDPQRRGFGVLAPRYSDEPNTRYQGGMLGWLVEGQKHLLIPEVLAQGLLEAPAVGLSETVLVHEDTAWLFHVQAVEAPNLQPFEQVRAKLEQALRAQKQACARLQLRERASQIAPVEVLVDLPQYEDVVEPQQSPLPSL